jgi:hypothetical protein
MIIIVIAALVTVGLYTGIAWSMSRLYARLNPSTPS